MNQTLIASMGDKNIYLINDRNIPFYICIPNNGNGSIVLNLVDNSSLISLNNSNMSNLTNELVNVYSKFNFSDIAIVTPIIDNNILEQVKLANNSQVFLYLEKVLGYLINVSYNYLKNNNINVDNKIKLNNNISYSKFNNWFISKYNSRIELVDYSSAPNNKFDNVSLNNTVESDEKNIANEVLDNTSNNEVKVMPNEIREPGFVSYVLLGVIVAVVSLVILYMLL